MQTYRHTDIQTYMHTCIPAYMHTHTLMYLQTYIPSIRAIGLHGYVAPGKKVPAWDDWGLGDRQAGRPGGGGGRRC